MRNVYVLLCEREESGTYLVGTYTTLKEALLAAGDDYGPQLLLWDEAPDVNPDGFLEWECRGVKDEGVDAILLITEMPLRGGKKRKTVDLGLGDNLVQHAGRLEDEVHVLRSKLEARDRELADERRNAFAVMAANRKLNVAIATANDIIQAEARNHSTVRPPDPRVQAQAEMIRDLREQLIRLSEDRDLARKADDEEAMRQATRINDLQARLATAQRELSIALTRCNDITRQARAAVASLNLIHPQ